jgi:excisionase family DNA binding protein
MAGSRNATDGRNVGGKPAPCECAAKPLLLTVGDVAELLGCSTRNVYRLADSGRMPRPLRIGGMVRWPRATIEAWIADNCPCCEGGRDA